MRWWVALLWLIVLPGAVGSDVSAAAQVQSARVIDPHDGSRRFTWSRTSSSYSTFSVTSVGGVCGVSAPEMVVGSFAESVTSRMDWLLRDTVCEASRDGRIAQAVDDEATSPSPRLFLRLLRTKDISLDRAPHRFPKDLARLTAIMRKVPTSDALSYQLDACAEAPCQTISVAIMMFSVANRLEAVGEGMGAATWRVEAMRWVLSSDGFIAAFREPLIDHAMALYDFAEQARDLGLARQSLALLRQLDETPAHINELQARIDTWQSRYVQLAAAQGVSFALSKNTALSGRRFAAQQFLSAEQFRLEVLSGRVSEIYLDCANPDQPDWQEYRLGRQLQLAVDSSQVWSVPEQWQDCALLVFADDKAEVRLWEFPAEAVAGVTLLP